MHPPDCKQKMHRIVSFFVGHLTDKTELPAVVIGNTLLVG